MNNIVLITKGGSFKRQFEKLARANGYFVQSIYPPEFREHFLNVAKTHFLIKDTLANNEEEDYSYRRDEKSLDEAIASGELILDYSYVESKINWIKKKRPTKRYCLFISEVENKEVEEMLREDFEAYMEKELGSSLINEVFNSLSGKNEDKKLVDELVKEMI